MEKGSFLVQIDLKGSKSTKTIDVLLKLEDFEKCKTKAVKSEVPDEVKEWYK